MAETTAGTVSVEEYVTGDLHEPDSPFPYSKA